MIDQMFWLLAEGPPGPEQGKASPIGLVVILLLAVAVAILGWSMQKHLKKVPKSFDEPEAATYLAGSDEQSQEPR